MKRLVVLWLAFSGFSFAQSIPFPGPGGVASPHSGYSFARAVTIDHTQVGSSDSSNFPVLVSGTYSYLATVANSGNVQSSSGYDIIFTSDSACGSTLNFQRVIYTAASGLVEFWVNVSTISHTSDTVFYECYGDSSITTDQSNATATWNSAFELADHFGDGTTLSLLDSTSNGNNGINTGVTATAGQINGGANFDGSSHYFKINNSASLNSWPHQTISFWLNANSGLANFTRVIEKGDNNEWAVVLNYGSGNNKLSVQVFGSSNFVTSASTVTAAWHKIDVTILDNNPGTDTSYTAVIFIDGSSNASFTGGASGSKAHDIWVGQYGGNGFYLTGKMDELRISNVVRSGDWLTAEYNNQKSSSTFLTISAPL